MSLGVAVGGPVLAGQLLGFASFPSIRKWYPKIRKPKWTPPVWLFGPTWGVMYSLMGYSSWRVWRAGAGQVPLALYAVQLLLNLAWQPLFFIKKDLKAASIDISVLLVLIGATVWEFNKVDQLSAQLMLPYFAWTSFAAVLTYKIRSLNQDSPEAKTK